MADVLPSIFLPRLPKSQYTLAPLEAGQLLIHIHTLQKLYLPPVVGLGPEGKDSGYSSEDEEDEEDIKAKGYEEPFERDWAEKWLNGIVRRGEGWLEEVDEDEGVVESEANTAERARREQVMHAATAALGVMAGTSESASITRDLSFPLAPSIAIVPDESVTLLIHDAPMMDHLSVGVQTWGSAILMGRRVALAPHEFGLCSESGEPIDLAQGGPRILELGAGTGLLSILCRKLMDQIKEQHGDISYGTILATDFLPSVLDNLATCVDLNFPGASSEGLDVLPLDWTLFPGLVESQTEDERLRGGFDLVLASDCVYDTTHADLLRQVAELVLRPPSGEPGDIGGTMHLLSPLRPTFGPELASIDEAFPVQTDLPKSSSGAGNGLGRAQGLRLGVRGDGKLKVRGRKGEGRTDESGGYWWWIVGWA